MFNKWGATHGLPATAPMQSVGAREGYVLVSTPRLHCCSFPRSGMGTPGRRSASAQRQRIHPLPGREAPTQAADLSVADERVTCPPPSAHTQSVGARASRSRSYTPAWERRGDAPRQGPVATDLSVADDQATCPERKPATAGRSLGKQAAPVSQRAKNLRPVTGHPPLYYKAARNPDRPPLNRQPHLPRRKGLRSPSLVPSPQPPYLVPTGSPASRRIRPFAKRFR